MFCDEKNTPFASSDNDDVKEMLPQKKLSDTAVHLKSVSPIVPFKKMLANSLGPKATNASFSTEKSSGQTRSQRGSSFIIEKRHRLSTDSEGRQAVFDEILANQCGNIDVIMRIQDDETLLENVLKLFKRAADRINTTMHAV